MSNLFLFISFLFFVSSSYAQEYCKTSILIDAIDRHNRFFLGKFNEKIDNHTIQGTLETCKGQMSIKVYNEDSVLVCKGNYMESLDTLKHYVNEFTIGYNNSEEIVVASYFQPLKVGTWYFYDERGEFLRKEEYERGIKISESKEE